MFRPLPMQHVTLHVLAEDARTAALVLAECAVFDPQRFAEDRLPDLPAENYQNLVRGIETRLQKILAQGGEDLKWSPTTPPHAVAENELIELNRLSGDLWAQMSSWVERLRELAEEEKALDQLMMMLVRFLDLDIDLSWLQKKKRLLDVRAGTMPSANLRRLQEALGLEGYLATCFLETDKVAHMIVAGPGGEQRSIAEVLRAAEWQPLELPEEFTGRPDVVRRDLFERRQRIEEERRDLKERIAQSLRHHREQLLEAVRVLAMARPYAQLGEVLRSRGGLAAVSGWVPKFDVSTLEQTLRTRIKTPLVLTARDPLPGEDVPSYLPHHRLLQPFASLVKNYGVPRYREVDPTFLFTFTYIVMFGMMFGDIGQGAVIAVMGLLLRGKLAGYAPFVVAAGIASTAFGFLYGSVFGFEELISPLWVAPLSNPVLMLKVALYWGIGFILFVSLLAIYNRFSEGRIFEALFDGKGLSGLLLYLDLVYCVWQWLSGRTIGAPEALIVVISLGGVLVYGWIETVIPLNERILVVFIEVFETLIAYLSNTLSFLRVAAFSLNHVALALAVFALAEGMQKSGRWVVFILGNVFIMVLEGAIVTIQALRLEYYEGFSRFFRGDGREFHPLALYEHDGDGYHSNK